MILISTTIQSNKKYTQLKKKQQQEGDFTDHQNLLLIRNVTPCRFVILTPAALYLARYSKI